MNVPQGTFTLCRCPENKKQGLRAWDAADEYLLKKVDETVSNISCNVLIVNDAFGALTTALANEHAISNWGDSFISFECIDKNLKQNNISSDNVGFVNSVETPQKVYDLVLIKIPKNYDYLQDLLIRLKACVNNQTIFIAAAMAKNIHTSTLNVFEKNFSPVTTSKALKKARLVYADCTKLVDREETPFPRACNYDEFSTPVINYSNVFSNSKLDIGTRFLLQSLPENAHYQTMIDLACGNGIVGVELARRNPQASILFTDESFMAVQSAKESYENSALKNNVEFLISDCLQKVELVSADLIVVNPPFHQQHVVSKQVAKNMFSQAFDVLKNNGEIWVVANRHLGYHVDLKRIFGNSELIASNSKFVVLKSVKPC